MQEAQPAEAEVHYPQPTQSEPDVAEDLAPPVTNTSNTHPEPEPEMPPVEETPVQPEFDPLDSPITSPAIDPSPTEEDTEQESFPVEVMEEFDAEPAEEMEEYDSGPAEEAEENDVEPTEEKDPLDDLFGEVRRPAALSVPGGLESGASRRWTDNTAKYHCEARLLGVAQGKIVLAKADGKISHVPLRRLSDRDLNFVYQQVVAKRELLARQAETEKIASVWSK